MMAYRVEFKAKAISGLEALASEGRNRIFRKIRWLSELKTVMFVSLPLHLCITNRPFFFKINLIVSNPAIGK